MLDAGGGLSPSPLDVPPIKGVDVADPDRSWCVTLLMRSRLPRWCFKIMTDPYVGQLAFFRVYSGTLKSGDSVFNVAKGRKERIGRLLRMHANKREEIQEILAGDICAAVGLRTVLDRRHDLRRRSTRSCSKSITFPTPVIQLAVEPQTRPTRRSWEWRFRNWRRKIPPSGSRPIRKPARPFSPAWASCALEIIVDRMMREFGVGANVGKPQVAYRETIRKSAEAEGRHIKQSGGHGQYGVVKIRRRTISGRRVRIRQRTSPADASRRNTSTPPKSGLRKRSKAVSWPATPCRTSRLRSTTAAFTTSILRIMAFKIIAGSAGPFKEGRPEGQRLCCWSPSWR